jgi:hypothetical protein
LRIPLASCIYHVYVFTPHCGMKSEHASNGNTACCCKMTALDGSLRITRMRHSAGAAVTYPGKYRSYLTCCCITVQAPRGSFARFYCTTELYPEIIWKWIQLDSFCLRFFPELCVALRQVWFVRCYYKFSETSVLPYAREKCFYYALATDVAGFMQLCRSDVKYFG